MIGRALERAVHALAPGSSSPRLDAELLLAHVLDEPRARLLVLAEQPLPPAAAADFAALIGRRAAGEPVAYLLGRRDFWTLSLKVGPGVLVPRPDTELLVELALTALRGRTAPAVLDLGTGTGAIGLSIAQERADARVHLVDASDTALAYAQQNLAALGLANVTLTKSDWFTALAGRRYDLVVSNPPYLAADDPHLAAPELRHEPGAALVSGPSGLEALAAIAATAGAHLTHGGWLLLEHGSTQGAEVRALLAAADFQQVATHRDLAGLERATQGLRPD